jgi:hypothetical protein
MKDTRTVEPWNWMNDFESCLQNEVLVVVLLFLWSHTYKEALIKITFLSQSTILIKLKQSELYLVARRQALGDCVMKNKTLWNIFD